MAGTIVILSFVAALIFGCSENKVIDDYMDGLGFGHISVVSNSSPVVYTAEWSNRHTLGVLDWSYKREFSNVDFARKFVADTREKYRLYLMDLQRRISTRDSLAVARKRGQ